ncbi:DUF2155 domain-containing protein [Kordiimonas lacus]|uniref:DUF2155 domain-containing protein n=1 Tax=Kordiimonas lacus TaxID=637679 RepID=A0A1G7CUS3_9PROT|nr:DUF2155 domain-containing protein [Kordiimonas lacus]SDE42396.1 hypothetical protein SAMN04488071_2929 [Kordiimonas lacus]
MKAGLLHIALASLICLSGQTAAAQDTFQNASQPTEAAAQKTAGLEDDAKRADNVAHNVVVLRALDKITARITEIELPVGDEARFGTLALKALYCRTRQPIEPPETFAYLEIEDLKRNEDRERVFEGWMVASSPALNPLEHSVYDVWVINCKTVEPSEDAPKP